MDTIYAIIVVFQNSSKKYTYKSRTPLDKDSKVIVMTNGNLVVVTVIDCIEDYNFVVNIEYKRVLGVVTMINV